MTSYCEVFQKLVVLKIFLALKYADDVVAHVDPFELIAIASELVIHDSHII